MNKNVVIGLVVVLIVAIGAFVLFTQQGNDDTAPTLQNNSQNAGSQDTVSGTTEAESAMNEDSRYVIYTPENFAQAADKKRVYYFYAAWCPTCRPTDKEFMTNASEIPEDVVVFRTDYDTENALKEKYNVTYQHTFVQVDSNGNEVTKWNGGALEELKNNIR